MTKRLRIVAFAVLGALGLGFVAPTAAEAGSRGRRNTAIALGAVSLYGIATRKPLIAGLGAGGAIYSYVSSRNARRRELRRERRRRYARRYYRSARYAPRYYGRRSYRTVSYVPVRRTYYRSGRYCY